MSQEELKSLASEVLREEATAKAARKKVSDNDSSSKASELIAYQNQIDGAWRTTKLLLFMFAVACVSMAAS